MVPPPDSPTPPAEPPSDGGGVRPPRASPVRPARVTAVRWFWKAAGLLFVGLAIAGAVLPLLPTTPFVLLAAGCFARGSPRLRVWLHRSRLFGPMLRDWRRHGGVRPRVKLTAVAMVLAVVGYGLFISGMRWELKVALAVLAAIGLTVVLRLKTVRD